MDDRIGFRSSTWLMPRRTALLTLAAVPLLSVKPSPARARFTQMAKAMWVWKDRILDPDELALFCQSYRIGVLFLYLTPQAGEALLSGERVRERLSLCCVQAVDACMPALASQIG
jgi:hypothetical protein